MKLMYAPQSPFARKARAAAIELDAARHDGEVSLGVLEKRLNAGSTWLASSGAPTVADIACFPYVALVPEGGLKLAEYPSITHWISRMKRLPGYIPLP